MGHRILTNVPPLIDWAERQMPLFRDLLREFVECESPSDDPVALERFGDVLAEVARRDGATVQRFDGSHVECQWGSKGEQVLVLAHSDTVWPMGTLAHMPFREGDGRLWGPGVLDIKGGIALFLFAMRAAREFNMPLPGRVLLQVNADEEVGSESSRSLTERNALESKAVLVMEPGTGLTGKLKTERKGVGDFRIQVEGRASHAGVDFERGASAVVELARQIEHIATWTDLRRGLTVNPGVIGGGTRSNVVAAHAWVEVDFRIARMADAAELETLFLGLQAIDHRCTLRVTGGLNRPPMERSEGGTRLFQLAKTVGEELGFSVESSATGGGSDGNFTAALGVPTLDGLGCVGEGAHAPGESILLSYVPERIALLAALLARLAE